MKQNDSRACFRTIIGGQALIEGIMMRGPDKSSIVVRREDGTLVEKTEPLRKTKKPAILNWYFIRGVYNFGSSMIQGVRALEAGGFRSAVMEAVIAAYEKNQAL